VVFFITALLIVTADQLSKTWIRYNLPLRESLPETGFFQLTHIHNTGAAFGLFQGQSFPLTIIAMVGIILVLVFTFIVPRRFPILNTRLARLALGLILGGAAGNLIDRLHLSHVIDFIDIGIWPAFNVADSAINVGAVLFAYCLLFLTRAKATDSSA